MPTLIEATPQNLEEAAKNAIFLVEGWENLGDIEGKRIYRGRIGPWCIIVKVPPKQIFSESSQVEAAAEHLQANKTVEYTQDWARTALRRARLDENRRAIWPALDILRSSKKKKKTKHKANGKLP
jgi:hypothetical protein